MTERNESPAPGPGSWMARILRMLAKDLRRDLRAPTGLLVMLSFPVVFAGLLGLTFGGGDAALPRVELWIEDHDGGLASRALLGAFGSEQLAEFFAAEAVEVGEGRRRLEEGEGSALLVIPEGFTEDLVRGNPLSLQLVRNPAQQILPEAAEQLATMLAELLSTGSHALREPLDRLAETIDLEGANVTDEMVSELAVSFRRVVDRFEAYLFPPVITLEAGDVESPAEEDPQTGGGGPSVFLIVLPGVSVFALFMLGDDVMRDILVEQQLGTLRRQFCAPLGGGTVVAGKVLHTAVVATLSLVVLTVIGAFASDGAIDVVAFVLLSTALILMVTGTGALLYGLTGSERQGATIASVVYLVFAFVGGGFIQTDSLPAMLQVVSPYTPFYWATEGYRNVILGGGGAGDVLPAIGLLAGSGGVGLFVGSRLLQRKMLRGAA